MATVAMTSAAIGTVAGASCRWLGRRRGSQSPGRELDMDQIRADTGRRQRAVRTAGAQPRRPGALEVLITGPAGGSGE
jgi:hypothetical protein